MKTPKKTQMYNLEYWIGKKFVETTLYNKPIGVCRWKEKQLKETTHKMGEFKLKPIEL